MHSTGGRLNSPLVVTQMLRRKYSDGARASLSWGSMASILASMNGSISPQCPTIRRSPG